MSVKDHGLEAIRKSTEAITSAEYRLKTISQNGLIIPNHDNGSWSGTSTQDVYLFKTGVTTVGTLTINYTDSTKQQILDWNLV